MITVVAKTPIQPPWWAFWRKETTHTVILARVAQDADRLGFAFIPDADLADGRTGPVVEIYNQWKTVASVVIPPHLIKAGTVVTAQAGGPTP